MAAEETLSIVGRRLRERGRGLPVVEGEDVVEVGSADVVVSVTIEEEEVVAVEEEEEEGGGGGGG